MTVPAEIPSENDKPENHKPETDKKIEPGKPGPEKASGGTEAAKALAPAGSSPVNPFLAAAAEHAAAPDAPPPPRSIGARMLDYSAHAAIIVGLIGFAWTVGDHMVSRSAAPGKGDALPPAAQASASQAAANRASAPAVASAPAAKPAPKRDELAELRQSNQRMHDEIRALRSSVETLRNVVRRDTTPEQVRVLSAGLDGMKTSIGAMRSETSTAIAQLNGKMDKLQPGKVRDLSERLGRLEHQGTDPITTASIPRADASRDLSKSAPKPPVKPAALSSAGDAHASAPEEKPQVISGWVVRDVYQGVALVENKRGGTMEVVPGVTIPGAGVVKSIDKHGSGWTVTTSKGQFASAAPAQHTAAPRNPAPHNAYGRGYGYGYGYGYGPGAYRYGY